MEVKLRLNIYIKKPTSLPFALLSPVLDHILSHEDLAVWPFSKEVFWCLSFPCGSFGFVIYCPVKKETSHFGTVAQTSHTTY